MISDEGQIRAAYTMHEAAEMNLRAANTFHEAVQMLAPLLGQGYGSNLDAIIEQLQKLNDKDPTK